MLSSFYPSTHNPVSIPTILPQLLKMPPKPLVNIFQSCYYICHECLIPLPAKNIHKGNFSPWTSMPGSILFLPLHTQAPLSSPATVLLTLHPSPGDLTNSHSLITTYVLLTPSMDPLSITLLQILFIHFIAPLPRCSTIPFTSTLPHLNSPSAAMTGTSSHLPCFRWWDLGPSHPRRGLGNIWGIALSLILHF